MNDVVSKSVERSGESRFMHVRKTGLIVLSSLFVLYAITNPVSASSKDDFSLANNVWYFAEGTTRQGFDEWITIQNPGDTDARVTITFMMDDGYNLDKVIDVRGNTRYTLSVRDVIGSDRDVSTKVVSDIPVVVERPMYFVYEGEWAGGHCAIGATVTSTNWFFAEGCTGDTFEEFLCMQNPGALNADVHIEYMTSGDVNYFEDVEIPPLSRLTVKVEDTVPAGEDVSAELTSTRPIVAERPMYYNFHGAIAGGDNVVGVNNPQASWFFAEGYTSPRFWTYLCIQNPGDASATVRVYYLLTDGDVLFNEFAVPPNSRLTVDPRLDIGHAEFSLVVDSTDPVVVERPMYFFYKDVWAGGHVVMGSPAPGGEVYFAEGTTLEGFEEWMCIMNPNNGPAHVTFEIQVEGADTMTSGHTVDAHSRYTVNMNETVGEGKNISVKATSDMPVVIERPIYFDYQDKWQGGHCVVGFMS